MSDELKRMTIKVTIEITCDGEYNAIGSHEEIYDGEDTSNDKLAQTIAYAIPKQSVGHFDVIEICYKGEVIGHGENP